MPYKTFAWVDRQTGEIKKSVTGEYGKYPAQIFPVEYTDQGVAQVVTPIQRETAQALYQLLARPDLGPGIKGQGQTA